MSTFAVVPVKALPKSKTRLSSIFTSEERRVFTLAMLEDVLDALRSSRVQKTVLISSDPSVETFAEDFGVMFLKENREGINHALNQATDWCIRNAAESVLILPADIPLVIAKDIDQIIKLALINSVVISPSQGEGTNVLMQKPPGIISHCFGPNSFRRHIKQALSKNIRLIVYVSWRILVDIDSEKDFDQLLRADKKTASQRFLNQNKCAKMMNRV